MCTVLKASHFIQVKYMYVSNISGANNMVVLSLKAGIHQHELTLDPKGKLRYIICGGGGFQAT